MVYNFIIHLIIATICLQILFNANFAKPGLSMAASKKKKYISTCQAAVINKKYVFYDKILGVLLTEITGFRASISHFRLISWVGVPTFCLLTVQTAIKIV